MRDAVTVPCLIEALHSLKALGTVIRPTLSGDPIQLRR